MIPKLPAYHLMNPEELQPDDPPNEELERKRQNIDLIGALIGAAGGLGAGAYKYRKAIPKNIPRILTLGAAGYGVGAAGSRLYGSIFHPRQAELFEKSEKQASYTNIETLLISNQQKSLLAMSRAYAAKKRLMVTQGAANNAQAEAHSAKTSKPVKVNKEASLSCVSALMTASSKK